MGTAGLGSGVVVGDSLDVMVTTYTVTRIEGSSQSLNSRLVECAAVTEATTAKGEQTRQAILAAAVERFGRDGYRSSSVADIARDADVSGTLAYAYFDNKEALFLAALDHDCARLIDEGVSSVLETVGDDTWHTSLIFTLLDAIERHPLAHRVLAGLEPDVTDKVLETPVLGDLRTAVADRLRADQAAGHARLDLDPVVFGRGIVSVFLSLMVAAVQFGTKGVELYGPDVMTVLESAVRGVSSGTASSGTLSP